MPLESTASLRSFSNTQAGITWLLPPTHGLEAADIGETGPETGKEKRVDVKPRDPLRPTFTVRAERPPRKACLLPPKQPLPEKTQQPPQKLGGGAGEPGRWLPCSQAEAATAGPVMRLLRTPSPATHRFHGRGHVVVSLRLLGQAGSLQQLLPVAHDCSLRCSTGRSDGRTGRASRHPPSLESSRGQGELRLNGGSLLPQAGHRARERNQRERAAFLSRMRKRAPYSTDQDRAVVEELRRVWACARAPCDRWRPLPPKLSRRPGKEEGGGAIVGSQQLAFRRPLVSVCSSLRMRTMSTTSEWRGYTDARAAGPSFYF